MRERERERGERVCVDKAARERENEYKGKKEDRKRLMEENV